MAQDREKRQDKHEKTIADYVGDMVALESHIEEAIDRQLGELDDFPQAKMAVQRYHDMVKHNRDHMKKIQEQIGSTAGNPIIKAGSVALGMAAGLIDKVRTEGASKILRDDYTSFNLAAVSYTMLHTTAVGLGNTQVASACEEHLRGYAQAIQELNHLVPTVVVAELEKDGHRVEGSAAIRTVEVVDRLWKETAKPAMTSGMAGVPSDATTRPQHS